jgi:hypothetical protein
MKRFFIAVVVVFSFVQLKAQDITTMWPYVYPDFQMGKVYFQNESTLSAPLNIHLLKSTLHYLDQDIIKEAVTKQVVLVEINSDRYFMRNNQLFRVLSGDSAGFVAELTVADFNAVMETGGAYGSSSNVQATRKLSSIEVGGINITNHMELKSQKDAGSLLPISKQYFIVTKDQVYPATKKAISSQLSDEKRQMFKKFLKDQKINWKRVESLNQVLHFLND